METLTQTTSGQQDELNAELNSQTMSGALDTIEVSFATNIRITKTSTQSLGWIVEQIRTSKYLRENIAIIRSEPSIEKRQELKKKLLPYFSTALFQNGIRGNKSFKNTRFPVMDIDHIQDRLEEIGTRLREDDQVFISFISPSGDGYKVVFALDREISNQDEFRAICQQLRHSLKERYGVEADNIDDPARACFLSFDPDLYLNEHCRCISSNKSGGESVGQPNKKHFRALLSAKNPGDRTPTLASQIGTFIKRGIVREEAIEMCRLWNQGNLPPLPEEKVADTVNDMYERYDTVSSKLPVQFFERSDSYYKRTGSKDKPNDVMVTSFIMELTCPPKDDPI
ncbi:MAG TPA: BT4734/BF3469 family protein [Bacteroidota bacterium]|nr:BT4734/BF3469 family protein [Bacteroidota bacterium]